MMADYSRQIENAKRSIRTKGMLCTWSKPVAEVDEQEPWKVTNGEPAAYEDVPIVFLPTGRIGKETARALAGKEVKTGDVYGYMAAQSFVPAIEDTCARGSTILRVLAFETIQPAEQPILYIISFATS